ncbi:alkylmercury lyase [Tricladium varicosporioides]|nr:alkylmercury lyase [Hymenoscyphus varicosporioides]
MHRIENVIERETVQICWSCLTGRWDSSLTILIDGFDVTGRPREPRNQASCRLDLPTEEQILVALRGLSVLSCERSLTGRLQAAAFHILLQTVQPVSVDHLAARMDVPAGITSGIEELQRSAHIRLDSNGCVVGALGLSSSPTMHELSIGGSRFWAWCAFDVIGIFGATRASGLAQSMDPCNGEKILLKFADGIPQNGKYIVFMADVQSNSALCEDWCSKVNFFISTESAEVWVQTNGLAGSLVSVGNLVPVAVEVCSRLLAKGRIYGITAPTNQNACFIFF